MADRTVLHRWICVASALALLVAVMTSPLRPLSLERRPLPSRLPPPQLRHPTDPFGLFSLKSLTLRFGPVKAVRSENEEKKPVRAACPAWYSLGLPPSSSLRSLASGPGCPRPHTGVPATPLLRPRPVRESADLGGTRSRGRGMRSVCRGPHRGVGGLPRLGSARALRHRSCCPRTLAATAVAAWRVRRGPRHHGRRPSRAGYVSCPSPPMLRPAHPRAPDRYVLAGSLTTSERRETAPPSDRRLEGRPPGRRGLHLVPPPVALTISPSSLSRTAREFSS